LLAASASLFQALKFIGAVYLIWIGYKMWRTPVTLPEMATAEVVDHSGKAVTIFRDSFLITALNPKGILFFVAFVPQFIDPALPYTPQAATYVLTFTLLGDRQCGHIRLCRGRCPADHPQAKGDETGDADGRIAVDDGGCCRGADAARRRLISPKA
jgi:hypothetical protein